MKPYVFFLFTLFTVHDAYSQGELYRFSHIDANDGLSHNRIKCFLKDRRGFMWFGTVSGLNRYNGRDIRVYRNDPRDSMSIINDDVNKLFEDHEGRIWIATWSGLDIFDPRTETFRHKPNDLLKDMGIPPGNIVDIRKDRSGSYWFVHATQGLYRYLPGSLVTRRIVHDPNDSKSLHSNAISHIEEDRHGDLWVIHNDGLFEKLDHESLEVVYRNNNLREWFPVSGQDYRFIVDSENNLWLFIPDSNKGLFYFDNKTLTLQHIGRNSIPIRLNTDIVRDVVQDDKGLLWVGTDHGGINLIDPKKQTVAYIVQREEDEMSLRQNSINTLYKDDEGIIWVGTFKNGVSFYHENNIRFPLYRHDRTRYSRMPVNDVNCIVEDRDGNLWIGTNGAGLIHFNRTTNSYKMYVHDPKDPNTLSNNIIVSLCLDSRDKLWIGTYFGGLNIFDGKAFRRYRHIAGDTASVSDDSIWEIFEDSQHRVWLGTLTRGVDVFDLNVRKIKSYHNGKRNSIHANYIPVLLEDSEGNMWVGTGYGIDVIDGRTGSITHHLSQQNNAASLSNNSILALREDSRGNIWVGTHGGLNLFDKQAKRFTAFKMDDGLPHNSILAIEEDENHSLWISTPNGISNLIMQTDENGKRVWQFRNYDESDGLQGKQFNEDASLRTRAGELVFGGPNGLNIFHPRDIRLNANRPRVVLSDLQVFNKSVKIGEEVNGHVILRAALGATEEIVLQPGQNLFSIQFAALSYLHPEKNQYKYKLEGFSEEWLSPTAGQRSVTFTNLSPGEYKFRVLASNNDGVWSANGAELKIIVLPPFWKTRAAFVVYVILILISLFITRKLIQQRERMKFAIVQERQQAQRMHELDMMKIKFFTNVSHEFRTPLSLILTPLEKIIRNTNDPDLTNQFRLIQRNAKRLLNLVNQLLDFRKLEVQEIKLSPSEGDLVSFVQETVYSFSDLSEKKDIRLHFNSNVQSLETTFDQDKLEKILFNLLSNAFKFTPEHGEVSVSLNLIKRGNGTMAEIQVSDTGIGIPKNKLEKIFERFFQNDVPGTLVNQGSGIGLSITREFVRIHGGSISVESEVGKGSTFTVQLPVKEVANQVQPVSLNYGASVPAVDEAEEPQSANLPKLLLVEDNEDFRFYLKDNLKQHYKIIEARNGKEGWSKVQDLLPDLVVSDVMMPEENGIELCRKIKSDARVCHIPVILLTARTAEEQKLEGYKTGADDYVTKPFNFEILESRIKNLIHRRHLFQKEFRKQIEVKATEMKITSLDEKLIQRAIKCVEEHLSDPDFSVEELSRELGMSRVHLYKKLQALTGRSPLEFIRHLRLQHAAQLLEKSQLTVSEVAYKVGFNNPKYFARYFKEEFHLLPSAYSSERRK